MTATFSPAAAQPQNARHAPDRIQPDYTRIVVFGDSLSDTGNVSDLSEAKYGVRIPGPAADYTYGRFTRNFVVQGTAAEWALCWMGSLRPRLWGMTGGGFLERPHLVFFLHDELIVHTPAALAPAVELAMRESAAEAGRLLFGRVPVEWAVSVATVDRYSDAK